MLTIRNLETGYDKKQVLFGLSMKVDQGEFVTIIGPNGAGKSTILKTICGLVRAWKGELWFNGIRINGETPSQNVSRGIVFSPQGSRVFRGLTVMENLEIGAFQLPRKAAKERIHLVLDFFPVLKERTKQDAANLSGGEQQMLALARTLIPKPRLLMLDEPSLGLSPSFVNAIFDKLVHLKHDFGTTILAVEQKVREILNVCDKVYAVKFGKIAFEGSPNELLENKAKLKELFL